MLLYAALFSAVWIGPHQTKLEITSRCYFTLIDWKSRRITISMKFTGENHIALLFQWSYSKSHRVAISPKLPAQLLIAQLLKKEWYEQKIQLIL